MREIRDSGGAEFIVAEPQDLELFIGRLALRIGLWVAGTGLACAFVLGAFLTALRKDVQDAGRRLTTVENTVSGMQQRSIR